MLPAEEKLLYFASGWVYFLLFLCPLDSFRFKSINEPRSGCFQVFNDSLSEPNSAFSAFSRREGEDTHLDFGQREMTGIKKTTRVEGEKKSWAFFAKSN